MHWEEFVRSYDRNAVNRHAYPGAIGEAMRPARDYSYRWGELLWDALTGAPPPSLHGMRDFSIEYTNWVRRDLKPIQRVLSRSLDSAFAAISEHAVDEAHLEEWARPSMELNFHRLNSMAQQSWGRLLRPEFFGGPAALLLLERDRYFLAAQALKLSRMRDVFGHEDLFDPLMAPMRHWLNGALNEFDTLQALWALSSADDTLIALPAPAQFEQLAGGANIDLLVLDTRNHTACGIQVKSSGVQRVEGRYDVTRVVLVDGVRDLSNVRAVRTHPMHSDRRRVPWPGIVSAHHLLDLRISPVTDTFATRREIVQNKLHARHVAGTILNRNREAYANLAERVRAALAEPTESAESSPRPAAGTP
ncbi:hypothetical protein [Nocardioides sp.]|uniref:hypothetical protein n=1 Tax=Nocardioides sp. TaxID=35761 RepID=UPI0039E5D096